MFMGKVAATPCGGEIYLIQVGHGVEALVSTR
jgi:hypothetical protein